MKPPSSETGWSFGTVHPRYIPRYPSMDTSSGRGRHAERGQVRERGREVVDVGPTGGSAQEWSVHPWLTRFDTVVMLTPTSPSSVNLTAPIQLAQPSAAMSNVTRSGVEGSWSGSMKYVPGSSSVNGPPSQTSSTVEVVGGFRRRRRGGGDGRARRLGGRRAGSQRHRQDGRCERASDTNPHPVPPSGSHPCQGPGSAKPKSRMLEPSASAIARPAVSPFLPNLEL